MSNANDFQWRGARALVILHEQHLREFLRSWREFKSSGLPLPKTEDPAYASHEELLRHVLRAARGYMTWMCEKLELPDPGIEATPDADEIVGRADAHLEHVLERWRTPLVGLTEEQSGAEFKARWGGTYCIDAMLEHAVMHPIRHGFQLKDLMARH
jgi:hypothetical protein